MRITPFSTYLDNCRTKMVGQDVRMPVALSPCGFGGMMWPNGEAEAAQAAEKFGVPFSCVFIPFVPPCSTCPAASDGGAASCCLQPSLKASFKPN